MEKAKTNLLIALVVVSIVCLILVVNVVALNAQINTLRPKAERCDALEKQLQGLKKNYDQQVALVAELRNNFDAAVREANSLRATNSDLQARLNAALATIQASTQTKESSASEAAPEATIPVTQ